MLGVTSPIGLLSIAVLVIDVAVNVVGDDFVATTAVSLGLGELTTAVSERTEFLQRQRVKPLGLRAVNAVTVPDFLQQYVE